MTATGEFGTAAGCCLEGGLERAETGGVRMGKAIVSISLKRFAGTGCVGLITFQWCARASSCGPRRADCKVAGNPGAGGPHRW